MDISSLKELLPHRPPMFWIDELVEHHEQGGVCKILIRPKAYFMESPTLIRESSYIEFIAQAYGIVSLAKAYQQQAKGIALKETFLVGVSAFDLFDGGGGAPKELLVEVFLDRQLGNFSLIRGNVSSGDKKLLATAQLKLYSLI